MSKQRAQQLYKLADSLSKVNVATLSEEQVAERNAMVARLQEELKGLKEAVTKTDTGLKHTAKPGQYGTDDKEEKQEPELSKSKTSALDKAFDVHWNKKPGPGRYGQVDVDESIEEQISTEAYDRLKKVFDFSDFKG